MHLLRSLPPVTLRRGVYDRHGSSATSAAVAIDGGVDAVLGVDLGLAARLAEAVDAERHGAGAEGAAERTTSAWLAPSITVTTGRPRSVGCDEPLEVRRRRRCRRAAARVRRACQSR